MFNVKKIGILFLLIVALSGEPLIIQLIEQGELTVVLEAREGSKIVFGKESSLYRNLDRVSRSLQGRQRVSRLVFAGISVVH